MSRIIKWLRATRISLNVPKTKIIIFRSNETTISNQINLWIWGQKIKTKKETKYQGIIKDEYLYFKTHVESKDKAKDYWSHWSPC